MTLEKVCVLACRAHPRLPRMDFAGVGGDGVRLQVPILCTRFRKKGRRMDVKEVGQVFTTRFLPA